MIIEVKKINIWNKKKYFNNKKYIKNYNYICKIITKQKQWGNKYYINLNYQSNKIFIGKFWRCFYYFRRIFFLKIVIQSCRNKRLVQYFDTYNINLRFLMINLYLYVGAHSTF